MLRNEDSIIPLPKIIPPGVSRRFERNQEIERMISPMLDSMGHINGQGRFPVSEMRFGRVSAGFASCEVIAVYNVLNDLGMHRSLSELIYYDEALGFLFAFGYFGTKISKIGSILSRLDVQYEKLRPGPFLRKAVRSEWEEGQIFIGTIRTRSDLPVCPLHTFEMVFCGGKWIVFNRFDNCARSMVYDGIESVLWNGKQKGKFYSIYRILR